jgi:pimeloyl-ACP methyl ester carboxylesterase
MQRPMMDPTFLYAEATPPPRKKKLTPFQRLRALVWGIFRLVARLLLFSPFGRKALFRNEEGTRAGRFVRGLTYRLGFVPIILVIFLTALVFAATHPGSSAVAQDPQSLGVYYDPVNFLSEDGARLEGWLVPVLDAKRVLEQKDLVIGKRYPAVVLVHDFAASRQQVLPMVKPLHNAGFVVLAINLRGTAALAKEAQTFGIKEALDVKAAVEMLRRRAFVDPTKIAVLGIGTGANAALIAGRNDPAIAALVVSAPVDGFDQAFAGRVGSDRGWMKQLRPLFRWTFQSMYGVDTSELDLTTFIPLMQSRHVLMTDGRQGLMQPNSMRAIQKFLDKHLNETLASASR